MGQLGTFLYGMLNKLKKSTYMFLYAMTQLKNNGIVFIITVF